MENLGKKHQFCKFNTKPKFDERINLHIHKTHGFTKEKFLSISQQPWYQFETAAIFSAIAETVQYST